MCEEVPDRDVAPRRWHFRDEFGDVVAERKLAVLHKYHDAAGDELLTKGADTEHGVWLGCDVLLAVGESVARDPHHRAVFHDGYGNTGNMTPRDCRPHELIHVVSKN